VTYQVELLDQSSTVAEIKSDSSSSDSDIPGPAKIYKHKAGLQVDSDSSSDGSVNRKKSRVKPKSVTSSDEDSDSSDEEVTTLRCTTMCAKTLEQIANVAKVWKLICAQGQALSQIPDLLHRYNRQSDTFTDFEKVKILIYALYTRAKDEVKFTNTYISLTLDADTICTRMLIATKPQGEPILQPNV
jgi:hypothetical protein